MSTADERSIQETFEQRVRRTPQAVAFISGPERVTFAQTNESANRLAHCLRSVDVGPGDFVGVCMDNSPDLPAALLGILKAGAAFVGLDPAHPRRRRVEILADADCRALIVDEPVDAWEGYGGRRLVVGGASLAGFPTDDPGCGGRPDDPFQVVYTSGSTGRPKGVVLPQRSFMKKLDWIRQWCPPADDDVLLMYRSINLAAGTWDCFMGLLTGLPTVVVSRERLYTPGMLYSLLRNHRVSHLFASPVLIREVLRRAEVEPGSRPRPRVATSSGEHLPDDLVRRWKQVFPGVPLLDVYGASEYSSAVIFDLTAGPDSAVISRRGRPATNTRVYVLNEDLSQAAAGETGEICLSGSHMALGYLNDPDLTAERFVPNPHEEGTTLYRTGDSGRMQEDGGIEVIGRNSEIVNISGFRVGLAEVENALADHESILESAVVPVGEAPRLVAFIVAASALSEVDLRKHLAERLPLHMIPAHFVTTDRLPRTPAGKLDRNSLLEGFTPASRGGAG